MVRSGLSGGKTVPDSVRGHPRLFVTLTAPSFGPVHRATTDPERCRPRRDRPECEHGRPLGCPARHADGDPNVGQPLCPACYDYTHHALWNAHTRELWDGFTRTLRRRLASAVGLPVADLGAHVRVSFAKVAEYQARGVVHFHAVVRLDGPAGPAAPPPDWATADLLGVLVPVAAAAVTVAAPESDMLGSYMLRWGPRLDVQPIRAFGDGDDLSDAAVAGYLAKYVTKSSDGGAVTLRLRHRDAIDLLAVTDHVRALLRTCWDLGALPELAGLRLRPWAHMLGYRGHVLTKSRTYSTTYRELRAARADHRRGPGPVGETVTEAHWHFAGSGYTPTEADFAAGIADDHATNRQIAREELGHGR